MQEGIKETLYNEGYNQLNSVSERDDQRKILQWPLVI